jgi:acetyl esterase/lipase
MRRQRSGHILNLSSLGARAATPGLAAYQVAKWAVSGFTEVLSRSTDRADATAVELNPPGVAAAGPATVVRRFLDEVINGGNLDLHRHQRQDQRGLVRRRRPRHAHPTGRRHPPGLTRPNLPHRATAGSSTAHLSEPKGNPIMPEFHPSNPLVTGIDPAVLDAQRQANAALREVPHPDPRTPDGLQMLRTLTANNVAGTKLSPADRVITTSRGDVRLRVFLPDSPVRGVMLDLHGGGWAAGAPEDDDTVNDQLARACRLAVAGPQYRLVPEVTIAEQVAECVAVAEWLAANAATEFGSGTLLIGGISAGAHLAAATLLQLRAAGSPAFAKFAAVRLDSGPYDLGMTASAYLPDSQSPVLPHYWLVSFLEMGLPGYSTGQRRTPELSPMLNDLSGLPPALFTVGDLDPLRDESVLMAQRWQLAGNVADLDVWPEGDHAFSNMATPLADLALARTTSWITSTLDQAAPTSRH